ncbi:hypothetical protein CYMTET_13430, partial [Cymbomonas tetramitiformis]
DGDKLVLGIMCDGLSYVTAPTIRERDRLLQFCLERLGWRVIRVWLMDWVTNRDVEVARIMNFYREALGTVAARPACTMSSEQESGYKMALGRPPLSAPLTLDSTRLGLNDSDVDDASDDGDDDDDEDYEDMKPLAKARGGKGIRRGRGISQEGGASVGLIGVASPTKRQRRSKQLSE